jgi:very-short-patch-repair endonuclease
MGLKFRRQKPVGPYIVDFVCMEHQLVIEVDGGQHNEEGRSKDVERDRWLKGHGFTVLRFWNNDVLLDSESVLEHIRQTIRVPSPGAKAPPTPASGRGDPS